MKNFLKGKKIEVRKALPVEFLDIDIDDDSTTTIILPRDEYESLLREESILMMVARVLRGFKGQYIEADLLRRIVGVDDLDKAEDASAADDEKKED